MRITGISRTKKRTAPSDDKQFNFTDPDSGLMKATGGFIQGYNAQATVAREKSLRLKRGGRRSRFRLRKIPAEPVLGIIKAARSFRQCLSHGLVRVTVEWSLICAAHNPWELPTSANYSDGGTSENSPKMATAGTSAGLYIMSPSVAATRVCADRSRDFHPVAVAYWTCHPCTAHNPRLFGKRPGSKPQVKNIMIEPVRHDPGFWCCAAHVP